jgi:hypothetical protein
LSSLSSDIAALQPFFGLGLILFIAGLILIFSLPKQAPSTRILRSMPAVTRLNQAIAMSVESGTRIHIALGHSDFLSPTNASAFTGLTLVERIALVSVMADLFPVASSGNSTISILSQTIFRHALLQTSIDPSSEADQGRLLGPTPFSYAAGALDLINREQVYTNLFIGHFGSEVALLTDASEHKNATTLGASDSLTGQAVLYLAADTPIIGEELFALPAYVSPSNVNFASVRVQDFLRWLFIIIMVVGSVLKFFGFL